MEKSKTQIHEQKPPRKSKSEQELISAEVPPASGLETRTPRSNLGKQRLDTLKENRQNLRSMKEMS
uniref:Uncharacterized protein n=1 Tax=Vitis vinifera TaxID=29760 RepID=F6H1J3_VITVI